MFELKDWLSMFAGIIIAALGVLPLLASLKIGPSWFAFSISITVLAFIVAGAGFYLLIDAFSEIANSNSVGWMTALLGILFMAVGILRLFAAKMGLPEFMQFAWLNPMIYSIIFIIEGLFLMIACFAMEI